MLREVRDLAGLSALNAWLLVPHRGAEQSLEHNSEGAQRKGHQPYLGVRETLPRW